MSMTSNAARAAIALGLATTMCACASGPQHGGRGGGHGAGPGAGGFQGGYVARATALLFVDYDADGDRRVTRAEAEAGAEADFAASDQDGSSDLSVFELAGWAEHTLGAADAPPSRLSFDSDLSGSITRTEFLSRLASEFASADANGDGVLARSELVRLVSPSRGGAGGQRGGPHRGGGRGGDGGRPPRQ